MVRAHADHSLSCNERIGQGVRFNAEKRQVGQYYSTPIWLFRCKCPSCKSYFAIQTDPEHTRYVVESGAREQLQDWNPEEHGGFPIHGMLCTLIQIPMHPVKTVPFRSSSAKRPSSRTE